MIKESDGEMFFISAVLITMGVMSDHSAAWVALLFGCVLGGARLNILYREWRHHD